MSRSLPIQSAFLPAAVTAMDGTAFLWNHLMALRAHVAYGDVSRESTTTTMSTAAANTNKVMRVARSCVITRPVVLTVMGVAHAATSVEIDAGQDSRAPAMPRR